MVKFCYHKFRSFRAPNHHKWDQKQCLSAEDTTKQHLPAYAFKLMFIEICFDALGRKISAKMAILLSESWCWYFRKDRAYSWRIEREYWLKKYANWDMENTISLSCHSRWIFLFRKQVYSRRFLLCSEPFISDVNGEFLRHSWQWKQISLKFRYDDQSSDFISCEQVLITPSTLKIPIHDTPAMKMEKRRSRFWVPQRSRHNLRWKVTKFSRKCAVQCLTKRGISNFLWLC